MYMTRTIWAWVKKVELVAVFDRNVARYRLRAWHVTRKIWVWVRNRMCGYSRSGRSSHGKSGQ